MIVAIAPKLSVDNVAELIHRLGDIPPERILMNPPPGTATEEDLIALLDGQHKRICELIDGVLVEKPLSTNESRIAANLIFEIKLYLRIHDLGSVTCGDGALRLRLGLVRLPDVAFIPWDRMPDGEFPEDPIGSMIPELAAEIISESNTKREIDRKLDDYFAAGVRLVWIIDPRTESARIHKERKKFSTIDKKGSLTGGKVLPGFTVVLNDLLNEGKRPRRKPS